MTSKTGTAAAAKLAAIDARAQVAADNVRAVEAKAVRDTLAAYAAFGREITAKYEAVTAKGDRPAAAVIRWADVRPHVVGAGIGGRYCGMAEAACERAWIASRDLDTPAKVDAWEAAGTAAKLAAAKAKADAAEVAADEDASDETKAKAKADAKAAADAADHLAYEGTSLKSAVSFAAAKRGGRIDPVSHVITPGSGRGGTGGTAKAIDPKVRQSADYIAKYREGTVPFGILPIVGDVTVADVADLTREDIKHLMAVLAIVAEDASTAAEVAKANADEDEDEGTADVADAPKADAKADAAAMLAAELAALTAKVAALTA